MMIITNIKYSEYIHVYVIIVTQIKGIQFFFNLTFYFQNYSPFKFYENVNFRVNNHIKSPLYKMYNVLKLISSIPKKNSAFCMKTSYFMNKKEPLPPGCNFASGAVLLTIAFKVSAFHFFWPKSY